jgi:hypothetical protein
LVHCPIINIFCLNRRLVHLQSAIPAFSLRHPTMAAITRVADPVSLVKRTTPALGDSKKIASRGLKPSLHVKRPSWIVGNLPQRVYSPVHRIASPIRRVSSPKPKMTGTNAGSTGFRQGSFPSITPREKEKEVLTSFCRWNYQDHKRMMMLNWLNRA